MPDMKTIQEQVGQRLSELEELIAQLSAEFEQLKQVSGMLASTNGHAVAPARGRPRTRKAPAPAPPAAAKPAAADRPRRGGNRAQQALDLIAAQPGLSAAELADSMGMKRNYLYRVLPALEKDGRVVKQGRGYHLAADRTPAAA